MRFWLGFAALNGFMAVLAGALGAHWGKGYLVTGGAEWLATAERYQMVHALALGLVAALAAPSVKGKNGAGLWLKAAGVLFSAGLALFPGALYVLAFTGWRPVSMLAPLGGLSLMGGWLALLAHAVTPGRAS